MRSPLSADPSMPDPHGRDLSPRAGLKTNIMGHAMNDPYYRAVVEDEVALFPALAGEIEDTCLTCHAPMGHYYAHQPGNENLLDPQGNYRFSQADQDMHARAGVDCTFCHQVDFAEPIAELANGAFQLRSDLVIRGPYPDPVTDAMGRYGVEGDTAIRDAELCGSCHNLFTQVVDVDTGLLTGARFLEQATWFEWRNSQFGGPPGDPARIDCHVCHMATPSDVFQTRIATTRQPVLRSPFGTHDMPGGNSYMLALLAQYRQELGLDPALTTAQFNDAISQTRAFLREAATLSLNTTVLPGELAAQVTITNHTGHKLPSGFPSRRMWLHVQVRGRDGNLLFESGRADAQGRLALDAGFLAPECMAIDKPPGFESNSCFEPHRDVIDDAAQVAIYESVMADTNSDITHVLLHASDYLKDNRIPPAGFVETGADFVPQTAAVGIGPDSDFNAGGSGADTVTYRLTTQNLLAPFTVTARLMYQSIRPSFVDGMRSSGERVNQFKGYYSAVPPAVEEIAEASAVVFGGEVLFASGFESLGEAASR